jgi:hypothetical protein
MLAHAVKCSAVALPQPTPIRPPTGSYALRHGLLNAELGLVLEAQGKLVEECHGGITMNLDVWTDCSLSSILACDIVLPNRSSYLWAVVDVSRDVHDAEFMCGASGLWGLSPLTGRPAFGMLG